METYIALDVGGTKIAGALVSYTTQGEPPSVTCKRSVATEPTRGGDAVLASIVDLARGLAAQADCLRGAGIGTAGIVNPADGSILYANGIMPNWTG
ncbi:MAG: ROK family protein, partial [Eggerthellaceae bacterium]|nr:ROK family protein [Eggerthellaceae bacterium]